MRSFITLPPFSKMQVARKGGREGECEGEISQCINRCQCIIPKLGVFGEFVVSFRHIFGVHSQTPLSRFSSFSR